VTANIAAKPIPSAPALAYFFRTLQIGGGQPSRLNSILLGDGEFYAITPANVDENKLCKFEVGGLLAAPPKQRVGDQTIQSVPNTISAASLIIAHDLIGLADSTIWVHEALMTEREIAANKNLIYRKIGEHLYIIYQGELTSPTRIEKLLSYSLLSWHFLAFVTAGFDSAKTVDELVEHSSRILVGAYDGESFLYWKKAV
jgi:hypothetical protein